MIIKLDKNIAFSSFLFAIISWLVATFFVSDIISLVLKCVAAGSFICGGLSYLSYYNGKIIFSQKYEMGCLVLFLGILIGIIFNNYSPTELIKNYLIAFLLWSLYFFKKDSNSVKYLRNLSTIFYWTFLFFIIFSMIDIERIAGNFTFEVINDQNFTGLMIFLFFLYSWHFKRSLGILVCLYFLLVFSSSRGLFGMFAIFLFCIVFRGTIYSFLNKFFFPIWKLMSILFVLVMLLSVYWVNYVSVNELSGYREGFNDGSNKMRFSANVYAMHLIESDRSLWLSGYGSDLKTVLGVEEDKPLSEHTRYNDVRLVQPHNSILNTFLRIGVIPGLIYLLMISFIIDKLFRKDTIEFIIPYFVNASFMHSFFSGSWFLLWLLILYLCSNLKGNKIKL